MKYEVRWWATKKDVRSNPDGGYVQEKIDRAGETKHNSHQEAVGFAVGRFDILDDFDLVEIKILRLGDNA